MTGQPIDLRDLTILVPTANRPEQLFRFVRYYATVLGGSGATVMVADGSDPGPARHFDAMVEAAGLRDRFTIVRYGADLPFFDRLADALAAVATPLVMIAADDDFYFADWIDEATARMRADRRGACVAEVGNYFLFDLQGFRAFGEIVSVADGSPERHPVPYLEGETVEDRIAEVAAIRQGIPTIAWYALHRTATVAAVFGHAAGRGLPMLLAERYFTVAQAASGRTRFSAGIFLARQADGDPAEAGWRSEPPGLAGNRGAVMATLACTRHYLETVLGVDPAAAQRLVDRAFANEIAMMAQADRRRLARRLLNRFRLRRLLTFFRRAGRLGEGLVRDPRLPQGCDAAEMAHKTEIVRAACRPEPAAPTLLGATSPAHDEFDRVGA